jgi:hypothetical protein
MNPQHHHYATQQTPGSQKERREIERGEKERER